MEYNLAINRPNLPPSRQKEISLTEPMLIDGVCHEIRRTTHIVPSIFQIQKLENFIQSVIELLFPRREKVA
jgi:hypothetical protein